MERPARMIGHPFEDVGLFVGGVVVNDGMDDFSGRDGALDGVEEANEFLVAMPSHAASDHGSSRMLSAANRVVVPLRL